MKRKTHPQSYLLVLIFFLFGCSILHNQQNKLFTLKDAWYQSWMISEQEKGTIVTILLSDVEKDIVFDSVVFRGVQMPLNSEIKDGNTILTCNLNREQSRLMDDKETPVDKPNQIMYRYKGEKKTYIIESIRREEMKYRK